jgi:formate-dependent phosphoribosylglycinamide formyltransferase (GAR transformylase)
MAVALVLADDVEEARKQAAKAAAAIKVVPR